MKQLMLDVCFWSGYYLFIVSSLAVLPVLICILHFSVALNYGIFCWKDFSETAQYIMFYDMSATSTTELQLLLIISW
jgi:hypothetical protein